MQMLNDVIVLVRYPDYTRRAVIRQSRQSAYNRRHTKSGRLYAQTWHIVRWIDGNETDPQAPPVTPVADAL